jgi:hypothetical protein
MSDKVRDKIAVQGKLSSILLDYSTIMEDYKLDSTQRRPIVKNYADQIIDIFRKEGYMHPNDIVEGMVVAEDCPIWLDHGDDYQGACKAGVAKECDHLCSYEHDMKILRPATVRECLAGLAVKV